MNDELEHVLTAFRRENYAESIKRANLYIQPRAIDIDCWRVLTISDQRLGQIEKALESCNMCINIMPQDLINPFNMGFFLKKNQSVTDLALARNKR